MRAATCDIVGHREVRGSYDDMTVINLLRRTWIASLGIVVTAIAVGATYTFTRTPVFDAQATVRVVVDVDGTDASPTQAARYARGQLSTFVQEMTSDDVLSDIADRLELSGPRSLAGTLTAANPRTTSLIHLRAEAPTAHSSAALANAAAEVLLERIEVFDELDGESWLMRGAIAAPASEPGTPHAPNHALNLAVATLIGIIIGSAVLISIDRATRRIRTRRDIERMTDRPVIATLPSDPLARVAALESTVAEFGFLDPTASSTFAFISVGRRSSVPEDVARRLTAQERDVAYIAPVEGAPGDGLGSILAGERKLIDVIQEKPEHQFFIPWGRIPPNPADAYTSERMTSTLEILGRDVDVIILNVPATALTPTALGIARSPRVNTILVAQTNRTRTRELRRALDAARIDGAAVRGIVLDETSGTDA